MSSFPYPVNLELEGKPCLIVGGGNVALRRVRTLIDTGAKIVVIAPQIRDEIISIDSIECRQRPYQLGDVKNYWLVFACTNSPSVNKAICKEADSVGVWANNSNQDYKGSFSVPAVGRKGLITLSVATTGASPSLAKDLRDKFCSQLSPQTLASAQFLASKRAKF